MSTVPSSCRARSRHTGRLACSAVASAAPKAAAAAGRSCSRRLRPTISKAWQRTSGPAPSMARTCSAVRRAPSRSSSAKATSADRTAARAERFGSVPACGQADGRLDVMAGHRPPRRRYRRLGQAQVGLDPGFPGRRVVAQPPDEPGAGGGRLVDPARQGQRLDEHELGLGPLRAALEQVGGPAQGAGGGRQRPDLQRVAAGVPEKPPGPGPVSRAGGQVGGHVPPPALQAWVGGVDRPRARSPPPGAAGAGAWTSAPPPG